MISEIKQQLCKISIAFCEAKMARLHERITDIELKGNMLAAQNQTKARIRHQQIELWANGKAAVMNGKIELLRAKREMLLKATGQFFTPPQTAPDTAQPE